MKTKTNIKMFETDSNGNIKIIAGVELIDGESGNIYAEDAIFFSPRTYTKYMMVRAIFDGVQVDSSLIMFKPDEYAINIDDNGEIHVTISPNSDASKVAYTKLVETILTDIHLASRSLTTSAIRRASEKVGIKMTISPEQQIDNMTKIEEGMFLDKLRIEFFSLAKKYKIPVEELQNKSIEITGKKSSSAWTIEDCKKMIEYIKSSNYKVS
ncbi:MAG: hypothetical protein KIH08_13725 [Candidatus Freyarchaeota archaeon]|nr:hypothetical protein [Candidatus Jordarchaeia archaeon]